MKVKELVKLLEDLNQELLVVIEIDDNYYEIEDIIPDEEVYLSFSFEPKKCALLIKGD